MKVIIAGSRSVKFRFPEHAAKDNRHNRDVLGMVSDAVRDSTWFDQCTHVLSGMDAGVDTIGVLWGIMSGKIILPFHANWDKLGKKAGPIRNQQMVNQADALVLVWDGKSRGSADVKKKAEKKGIPVFERLIGKEQEQKRVWTF